MFALQHNWDENSTEFHLGWLTQGQTDGVIL